MPSLKPLTPNFKAFCRQLFVLGFALSIPLTGMASSACRDLLVSPLQMTAVSQPSLLPEASVILALSNQTTKLGQLTYEVSENEARLEIIGVRVEDDYLRQGVSEFLIRSALERSPEVEQVKAEYVQTNAEVVRQQIQLGLPLEKAILEAPTSKVLRRLGFTKLIRVEENLGLYEVRFAKP